MYQTPIHFPKYILMILFFLLVNTPLLFAELKNGFDISDSLIPQKEILQGGPPRDGIPAIHNPQFLPAHKASFLSPQDRVLGISMGNMAKAYPVRILNWHEIVNDRIGEDKFVITFCPLCGTGIAFSSLIQETELRFGVSGLLYNSDVLLYDLETESLWSQIMGTAVTGSLKGTRLTLLPLLQTSWIKWQELHPETLVLSEQTGFTRNYKSNPYAGYEKTKRLYFKVAHKSPQWLHPKEQVLGITVGKTSKAYPFVELRKNGEKKFKDTINDSHFTLFWDEDHDTAYITDESGTELPVMQGYWFAWYAFHPATQIFKAP